VGKEPVPDELDLASEEEREQRLRDEAERARQLDAAASRLTEAFAPLSAIAHESPEDLWAIRDWQMVFGPELTVAQRRGVLDKGYRGANPVSPPDAAAPRWRMPEERLMYARWLSDRLDLLFARSASLLPDGVKVYRGVRHLDRLGVDIDGDGSATYIARSVLATSLSAPMAANFVTMFSDSTLPAVIELSLPRGHMALWIPPIGDPALAYEAELLLPIGTRFQVTSACPAEVGEWAKDEYLQYLRVLTSSIDSARSQQRRSIPRMFATVGPDVR
jgi:hypothetical protein